MFGRWCSLFLVIVAERAMCTGPEDSHGHSPKKKVFHIKDEDVMSQVRTYSFEDFFWTGSGDGPLPPVDRSGHPTIIRTTTVLATVFLDSSSSITTDSSVEEDCLNECPINPASGEIDPTRVGESGEDDSFPSLPDPKYWLLTVLRAPAAPLPPSLSRSLARLYQKAFLRQQQQHLGIVTSSTVIQRKKHHVGSMETYSNETIHYDHDSHLDAGAVHNFTSPMPDSNVDIDNTTDEVIPEGIVSNDTSVDVSPTSRPAEINVTKFKRSLKTPTDGINIILLRNYSENDHKKYEDALDVVKRQIGEEFGQPMVEVFLHNLTKESKYGVNDEVRVVYWVSVGGRPVPALTAARDMKLLADAEVVAELGYPITTKAEPYLKPVESPDLIFQANNMRDLWIVIVGVVLAGLLLLSVVTLLTCRLMNRRKSSGTSRGGVQDHPVKYASRGKDNKAFIEEENNKKKSGVAYLDRRKGDDRYVTHSSLYKAHRQGSPVSSSSSQSASDHSQMTATLRQKQRLFEKQMQSDYASINKRSKSKHRRIRTQRIGIADEQLETDSTRGLHFGVSSPSSPSLSSCDSIIVRRPQGVVSPTSYLSMPSVKSFPRGNAVEPLSRVLEPLSVKHLDMDSDSPVHAKDQSNDQSDQRDSQAGSQSLGSKTNFIRMGSMDRDPGVIGPMVWDLHRKRMEKSAESTENVIGSNISKMRQRFSELVDDAFSLFGSGSTSPKENVDNSQKPKSIIKSISEDDRSIFNKEDHLSRRGRSANIGESNLQQEDMRKQDFRPHTGLPPRPPLPQHHISPTPAWNSNSSTPMTRSASAGRARRPTIDVALINSDVVSSNDPAVPLIQAIRRELDKLPGTSDA